MPLPYPIETPSQTAGPFLHIGLMPDIAGHERHPAPYGREIVGADTPGPRIEITGRVLDGTGTPVRDMLVEVWQADGAGIYNHPEDPRVADVAAGFSGFGRYATDFDDGSFRIETIKPGAVPGRHGRPQAPHLNLWFAARGVNIGLSTRLYFDDEIEANAADPVLSMIEQAERRRTLIAVAEGDGRYRFDIRLQGEGETVFLDI
ncbi:protocatechuate 3,4-dioxygenase subunit alpha (plasmid) [Roseivivax marinus]|jgi:protocatechuate 3,4-dioxygenase alpha subunit|uniref:protocatechuate 3,4-dioxygenase subunit alpha n=1 Tax=Roseivivax marinus TaxID=1379903 RepID=UPI001F033F5C|nr:protocatechuate 3,4-dioxygenase subunit alpha [Roseivivax marinus]UMA66839.1 protocatechuate 3,4-dioxygenase subunit alpha [Roseivivax marinus]